MHTFDFFGVAANLIAILSAFVPQIVILIVDALILFKNLKADPFYLTFAYFCPPGSEYYEQWYSRQLHASVVTVLGIPLIMEGVRTFNFNILGEMIIPLKVQMCLNLAYEAVASGPPSMSVIRKLEKGLNLYDSFCIVQLRGLDVSTFDCLMILGLGYAILMFNAAATVTAWGVLPLAIAWVTPVLTGLCIFMLIAVLPDTLNCYTFSEKMLGKWKELARSTKNARCISKQLSARQMIGFYFGDFRPINHEFRLVYLDSVMERTSNQILVYNAGGSFEI